MIIAVMIVVAVVCTLASHLGLATAVSKTVGKIFGCTKCFTFWISLAYFYANYTLAAALACATAASYLSLWIEAGLVVLNKKYNELWKRLVQKR